jgi:heme exporter protein A
LEHADTVQQTSYYERSAPSPASSAAISTTTGSGLEVVDLQCVRDDRVLFSGLGFALEPGQTRLVEGANGSGKTTLLRAICGFVRPEQGSIRWGGEDIERVRLEFQAQIAYLGHAHGIKEELTTLENLRVAQAMGAARESVTPTLALSRIGLGGFDQALVRTLSAGQRRRVALARLLLTCSSLWILDEPFTALDKDGIKLVESLLDEHCASGGMALISSHHAVSLAGSVEEPIRLS